MKRLTLAIALTALLLLVGTTAFAAAPTVNFYNSATGDVTITAQHTGTWANLDSLIVTASDTAALLMEVSGIAVFDPADRLYLSSSNGGVLTAADHDTLIVQASARQRLQSRVSFTYRHVLGLLAVTDTIYFSAAAGGGGIGSIVLEDVVVTATVLNDGD